MDKIHRLRNYRLKINRFLAIIFLISSGCAFSAEIRMAPPNEFVDTSKVILISGDVKKGDTDKLVNLLLNLPKEKLPVSTLLLGPSLGGNLEEAMNIGFLVRKLKWKVTVFDTCYSACSLIALSGVYRVYAGDIGLHRPYFESEFYGDRDAYDIEKWHKSINKKVENFLKDSYVEKTVIDKMMSVNSQNIWVIPGHEAGAELGNFDPYFEELILSRCEGKPTTMPDFEMNAACLHKELQKIQRTALITFLKAVKNPTFSQ